MGRASVMAVKIGLPDKDQQVPSPEMDEEKRAKAGSQEAGLVLGYALRTMCHAGVEARTPGTLQLGNSVEFHRKLQANNR